MTIEVDLVTSAGGNIGSVSRCLDKLGVSYRLTGNGSSQGPGNDGGALQFPDGSRPIVLPGVGAFGTVMNSLEQHDFTTELRRLIKVGTPFLGICVGMQVLFDSSEEAPGVPGLGIIPGQVCKYTRGKVPQIGWNKIEPANNHDWPEGFVYFVNSYYPRPESDSVVLYRSDYFGSFCAAVKTENITAFQFHPEKSGEMGHSLIRRWLDDVS